MSAIHHLDLRDRWRRDEQGRRRLTLRMIWARIQFLPPTSALAIDENDGKRPWTYLEYLLADLWEIQANRGLKKGRKPRQHPMRPAAKKYVSPEQLARRRKREAEHRRMVARRKRQQQNK